MTIMTSLPYAGKQVDDNTHFLHYFIEPDSTLHLVLQLRDGSSVVAPWVAPYQPKTKDSDLPFMTILVPEPRAFLGQTP